MKVKGEQMNQDRLLLEFKTLQNKAKALEAEIQRKAKMVIATKDAKLLQSLGKKLMDLHHPVYSAGSSMVDAAKVINETPTDEEKSILIETGKKLQEQLTEIYYAEDCDSFESELTVYDRCVVLNVKFGSMECETELGTYDRPECEGDIVIKKTGIKIKEYENTPDGINDCGTTEIETGAQGVLEFFDCQGLKKKEYYLESKKLKKSKEY